MSFSYKTLGKKVREHRKAMSLSTPELATRLSISSGLLNNIENGRYDVFKLELLIKIKEELNTSLCDLLELNSIDIGNLEKLTEPNKIFTEDDFIDKKYIVHINLYLNLLIKEFLNTLAETNCEKTTIETISNHLIQELVLIRKMKDFKKYSSL